MEPATHTPRVTDDGYETFECVAPSEQAVKAAIKAAVRGYKTVFGDRLAEVWLYGSRATGDHSPESDVDLLIVLHEEKPLHVDFKLTGSVDHPVYERYGVDVDGKTTTLEKLRTADDDYHYFIRQEGKRVDA